MSPFDTALARELTTFENQQTLEQALKWRLNRACDEIDALAARLATAREALEFYADRETWDEDGRAWLPAYDGEADEDRGATARGYLAAL